MATIMLPSELDWLLDLLGFNWPNVDEDKMREAAEAWSSFADAVRQYQQEGVTAANTVHGANSGEATEAFDNEWKKFAGGGGYFDEVIEAAEVLSFALEAVAMIVMVMKLAVIAQLIALAIEFAAAQAAAPVTLGASEAGAVAAEETTRMLVRRIIKEAAEKIVQEITKAIEKKAVKSAKEMALDLLKDVGKDMAKGLAQNLVTQGIESHFGARDGISVGDAARATAKPIVDIDDKGNIGFGDKLKDVGKVGTGAYHMAEGVGSIAQGDVAKGAKQIWDGHEEQVDGAKAVAGIVTKDKKTEAEGETAGDGTSEGGGETASSGSSSGSGSGESASSGSGESATTPRPPAPAPPPAPTTESGQAEAERARNAFG